MIMIPDDFKLLADIPLEHASYFGESQIIEAQPLVIEEDATILPRITISQDKDWSNRFSQGIFNAEGNHIESLNDQRSHRKLFFPKNRLEDAAGYAEANPKKLKFMLYGGTLYDHFGDMLVDTCRAYQLLRLYRHSQEKIWFHYAAPRSVRCLRAPFIQAWLDCLGLGERFRLIRRPMRARCFISCPQIYRDLRFISRDYPASARAALHPKLRRNLKQVKKEGHRIAYFSRHKLTEGTSRFTQESELVAKLKSIPEVDIICPEELSFEEKLSIWVSHSYVVGFPQGCLMLKPFVADGGHNNIAKQIFLVAGPKSLPSNWLSIEKACHFGDLYLDCDGLEVATPKEEEAINFTRSNSINVPKIARAIQDLAASLR